MDVKEQALKDRLDDARENYAAAVIDKIEASQALLSAEQELRDYLNSRLSDPSDFEYIQEEEEL